MTLYECQELKKRLAESTDFHQVQEYFFTNFVERGRFLDLGRALSKPRGEFLAKAAGLAYKHLMKADVVKITQIPVEIPEFGMIHGSLTFDGNMGSILYFEDTRQGLLTVVEDMRTGKTHYVRFSATRADAAAN
ncbi:MAG: hypothetical protein IT162_10090 [Bryobacterales bacterium]|nr:hypothetical protein [Bryobacterales bacterium]